MRDYFESGWFGEVMRFVISALIFIGAVSFVAFAIKAINYGFDHIRIV